MTAEGRRGPVTRTRDRSGARVASARRGVELFSPAQLLGVQRVRILAAMVAVACERGAANATVTQAIEWCGVSRRTFYELFADRDDCLLAAFDDAVERLAARVVPAWRTTGCWQDRVRSAFVELLAVCEQQPLLARFVLVESVAGGPAVLARRAEIQKALVAAIDQGRRQAAGGARPDALVAEGLVGGVGAVLASRLATGGEQPELLGLTGSLMSMIVLPYLGAAAARRETSRIAPTRSASDGARYDEGRLLHELGTRLTYRTMRVLLAVAAQPGASNRTIGDAAGIGDQGQTSKLLGRLQRAGLVGNTGAGVGTGMPNAWSLTEKGERVTDGVRVSANDFKEREG